LTPFLFNLKGFPGDAIEQYEIEALHPDAFLEHQFDLNQGAVIAAAKHHRNTVIDKENIELEVLAFI